MAERASSLPAYIVLLERRDGAAKPEARRLLAIEVECEEDGRWIGEVPALPGVAVYGATAAEARNKAAALALRVLADRIEHGEAVPSEARDLFSPAA